jgi:hypothetical protein
VKRHVGERFGRLTLARRLVPAEVEPRYRHPWRGDWWACRCDCGREVVRRTTSLLRARPNTSCGCARSLVALEREARRGWYTHGSVLRYYKRNAKVRNLSWALSLTQFDALINGTCYYCDAPPSEHRLAARQRCRAVVLGYNGIDRLDNASGYTSENCVSCCSSCNFGKMQMTSLEFIEHARKIARKHEVLG